mmetsp:Transcript_21888/g.30100  ORF Transcript_21888/g.30100 Transcript_21888/m.30100 type:complete len:242 (+) Transcript_21888:167-892(+)
MGEEEKMENWRQFQGTELGSLMSQLYGNQNKPKINYPKPKTVNFTPQKDFIPGGSKIDASDPRKVTRRSVSLAVPKVATKVTESLKPVDYIPKRRSAEKIKEELDDIAMRNTHYRPAHIKPTSSEYEKERLNQIFSFKGGKGLPEELTNPVGQTPMEVAERRKEDERIMALKEKRGMIKKVVSAAPLSESEQMAQHIVREIDERRHHIEEMRSMGALRPAQEAALKAEIATKLIELKSYDV